MYRNKSVESYLFASDKERVVERVMEMWQKIISALRDSVEAFINCDETLMGKVIDGDREINSMDEEIDLECLRSIAMRQPVREELRFIFAVLKTTTDLERIGDHAVNIARQAESLGKRANTEEDSILSDMLDLASAMLRDTLAAFKTSDGGASEEICRRDDQLDAMYDKLSSRLIGLAASHESNDSGVARVTFAQFMAARYLERVGDHCTNIAERIYFMDKGKNLVKH
ncbi:MAG: phosphate signaling complex protein PhoU [Synergistaceae bacterium]|nr:phosphate signaling complex protein PhoU [Synergistaceae bacterium]